MIPSLYKRKGCLSELLCDLFRQCGELKGYQNYLKQNCSITIFDFDNVEVIIALDNQENTTGAKRQLLLEQAKHEYCASIDCDDAIYPYYIEEILKAIKEGADCIAFSGIYTMDDQDRTEWRLAKDYTNCTIKEGRQKIFLRTTNHLSPVKRELALKAGYPDKSNAEDKEYSLRLNPHLKTETKIDKLMYWYRYSSTDKTYT